MERRHPWRYLTHPSQTSALRRATRTARTASRCGRAGGTAGGIEPLERRQLLSVAPVAAEDAYDVGSDGRLSVDVSVPSPIPENPLPPPPAFDESGWTEPTGPFTTPDFVKTVEGGQIVIEPDSVEVGDRLDTYGEVIVRGNSRWVVSNWFEAGEQGKGTVSVSDGGTFNTRNWTGIGTNTGSGGAGLGLVTVTGATSRWVANNWVVVGSGKSFGSIRLADHAEMAITPIPSTPSSGFIEIGTALGSGRVEVHEGATLRHADWTEIGNNRGRGNLVVDGGGLVATGSFAAVGDNGGLGDVSVSGAGSRWTVGNWGEIGTNGGRGSVRLSDGGSASFNNFVEVGRYNGSDGRVLVGAGSAFTYREYLTLGSGQNGTGRGTLFVAEGGRVIAGGGQGFGNGPEILNAVGGRILGSGSIQGKVTNGGFISPGGSVGVLTINGSLLQPAAGTSTPIGTDRSGTLQFDIGGTTRGSGYDGLDVSGAANIAGGTVRLNFVDGFAPHAGDRFTLIDAASTTAAPRTVEVRGLAPGFRYSLAVENGDLVLVAGNDGTSSPQAVQRKGVLANDADADGDRLTAVLVKRTEHGVVRLYADGSFEYAADAGFNGDDRFQYKADDGVFESNVATVTLHVVRPNHAPVAVADAYGTDEDIPLIVNRTDGVLKNDTDPDAGTTLTAAVVSAPAHGRLSLNLDGSFTYVPAENFNGTDSFTYRASDGALQSEVAAVTLTVRGVNDAPVAVTDRKVTRQDRALTFTASDLAFNDTDADHDDIIVTGVAATADTHGTVSLADGQVTYTPARHYTGPASFAYTVSDGHGGTATGTVSVTVQPKKRGTPGTAVGRGTLNGRRQSFAFTVVARSAGRDDELTIAGMLGFEDRAAHVVLRSTDLTSFDVDSNGKKGTLSGVASVNGRAGYPFVATLEDRSHSGANDRFRIVITGPAGSAFRYDSNARGNGGGVIDRGGNITIVASKKSTERQSATAGVIA